MKSRTTGLKIFRALKKIPSKLKMIMYKTLMRSKNSLSRPTKRAVLAL